MTKELSKIAMTPVRLIEVIEEAPETYTFKFEVPESISWTPGSHVHVFMPTLLKGEILDKQMVHELSIMSHPDEGYLGITTRIRSNPSPFKQAMKALKPGDQIPVFKIRNHLELPNTDNPIVIISMGVGIATFRPVVLDYIKSNTPISITNINVDRSGQFIYAEELSSIPETQLKNIFVTSRNDLYKSIDQVLENKNNSYYIVGSDDFCRDLDLYLAKSGVSESLIHLDKQ